MGYTHYWEHPNNFDISYYMPGIAADAVAVLDNCLDVVAGPEGVLGTSPIADETLISFNGIIMEDYDGSAEKFKYPPNPRSENGEDYWAFDFCKTYGRAYDAPVVAMLLNIKHHLGDEIILRTDAWHGDAEYEERMHKAEVLYHSVFPERVNETWKSAFATD